MGPAEYGGASSKQGAGKPQLSLAMDSFEDNNSSEPILNSTSNFGVSNASQQPPSVHASTNDAAGAAGRRTKERSKKVKRP